MEPLRILIAESNLRCRQAIARVLGSNSGMEVVGTAGDGRKTVSMTAELRPDIVLIGSGLRTTDALAAMREIMIEHPTPVLVVTSDHAPADVELAVRALRSGALSIISLPSPAEAGFERRREEFLGAVRALSQVKLVRRWRERTGRGGMAAPSARSSERRVPARIVAIASSTGGPSVLERILRDMPADFPAPFVVVQHISTGFIGGVAAWLGQTTPLAVRVAADAERLASGTVYLAPDNFHLGVSRGNRVCLSDAAPIDGFRPSANHLFNSVAQTFGGAALGVILTGMGKDGADGLTAIHKAGGRIIAQDEASSVVFGMPRCAIELGIVDEVLPAAQISEAIQASVFRTTRNARNERPPADRRG